MELFFDGTGASPSSSDPIGKATALAGVPNLNTVELQIRTFLNLAYKIKDKIHEPQYVMINWGKFIMTGVLASANVTYKMFAPDGSPLRATMSITINESISESLLGKMTMVLSPDLSKARIVEEGDTLPLLCHKEYRDASLYPQIAAVNNLKNYRKLKQGMELLFPPIDNLA
jgi:nucleoid-associated protein YgaU